MNMIQLVGLSFEVSRDREDLKQWTGLFKLPSDPALVSRQMKEIAT